MEVVNTCYLHLLLLVLLLRSHIRVDCTLLGSLQWDLQLTVSIGLLLDVTRSPFDDVLTLLLFVLLLGILTPGELYALPGTLLTAPADCIKKTSPDNFC